MKIIKINLLILTFLFLPIRLVNAADDLMPGLSFAKDISSDGTVVVGYSNSKLGQEATRWTSSDGAVGLGDLPGGIFESLAYGVSSDGTAVVGYGRSALGYEAFRWTSSGGMVGLGDLAGGGFWSEAFDASADGSAVVGFSESASGQEAFRWTSSGGMVGLGDLAGGSFASRAYGISNDGSVIVGWGSTASGAEAFRWTASGGIVGIGDLPGGDVYSTASDISGDGLTIVGASKSSSGHEAFRWTASGGMIGLGDLPGGAFSSHATAVSNDGSVVVGGGYASDGNNAFRWTETDGMQSVSDWLESFGINHGWQKLETAEGVSGDGSIIVGSGKNASGDYEAYIARGASGFISANSFATTLWNMSIVNTQGAQTTETILHGAHGHPGAARALDEKYTMWVAGDLIHDDRHDSKDDSHLGEVGLAHKYSDQLSFSLALGKTWSKSDLLYSGNSDSDGKYFAVDADIQLTASSPLFLTLTYLQGTNDVEIKRGYENAGSPDASYADTEQSFRALRSRLQWQSAKRIKLSNFHPYIEYNSVKLKTDGYTETGGGFPAVFNESSETISAWRLGFDADYRVNTNNRILYTLEGVHRTTDSGSGVSGNVIGLFAFDIDGRKYKQNWLRGTLGLEHTFDNKGRITLTFSSSTSGEDPQYWTGVNYSIGF